MNIRNYEIESIQFTEITNNQNLKVTFSNHGAEIFKIVYKNYVLTRNVKNIKDSFNPAVYNGRTVGRVSNRMRGNKFTINGETYELEANEDGNVLHGGPKSIAYQMFEQKIRTDDENIYLTYFKEIRDLEDGYPGNLRLEVRYIIPLNEDEIRVQYRAFSDKDTVLSLTNHTYFTLGCKNIEGLSLQIDADRYLNTDPKTLLKIGPKEVNPVLDFRETKRITQDISDESLHIGKFNGYDHFYYLNNKGIEYKACSLSTKEFKWMFTQTLKASKSIHLVSLWGYLYTLKLMKYLIQSQSNQAIRLKNCIF